MKYVMMIAVFGAMTALFALIGFAVIGFIDDFELE